jgi:CubicO group peptidase (beta-lactamase class C family)
MDRRVFLQSTSLAAVTLARLAYGQTKSIIDVAEQLEAIRQQYGIPGIAAAAVNFDSIVAEGVTGIRCVGLDEEITLDDRFAMASCTKRMTAAMIGRVIDLGRLSFDTTLAEALPNMPMRDEYRSVTAAQLLMFQGGIRPYPKGMKAKAGAKKKAPERPPGDLTARVAFFGGSNAVSSGCLGWPDENIAVVAAINAGFANDAIAAAHRAMREVAMG